MGTILLGAVVSLAASFLAVALGSARPRDGTPVVLFLTLYWLGADGARVAWARRRHAPERYDDLRRAFRDLALVISERDAAVRQHGVRGSYAWLAFASGGAGERAALTRYEAGAPCCAPQFFTHPRPTHLSA